MIKCIAHAIYLLLLFVEITIQSQICCGTKRYYSDPLAIQRANSLFRIPKATTQSPQQGSTLICCCMPIVGVTILCMFSQCCAYNHANKEQLNIIAFCQYGFAVVILLLQREEMAPVDNEYCLSCGDNNVLIHQLPKKQYLSDSEKTVINEP